MDSSPQFPLYRLSQCRSHFPTDWLRIIALSRLAVILKRIIGVSILKAATRENVMRIILLTAALVCLSIGVMAQDYAQPFKLQPYAFNPPILQQGLPGLTNPGELPAILKPDRSTGTPTEMNIQTNPQPVPVQPVQVQPIPQSTPPKPEPVEQAKPERIPWPEPGYNCCWPQNIDGSLHVDPDSFGGGN